MRAGGWGGGGQWRSRGSGEGVGGWCRFSTFIGVGGATPMEVEKDASGSWEEVDAVGKRSVRVVVDRPAAVVEIC